MEGAFHDLQGWLLSGQREAAVESGSTMPVNRSAGSASLRTCCRSVRF